MNTKLRYIAAFFAVTLALVWCIPSIGQVIKGSISGSVTDPQGAVVSGAQVKAKNIETGVVFPTTSDSAGLYRLNLLPVGRSEEHTSELQSHSDLVCRLLLVKKKSEFTLHEQAPS